MTTDAADYPAEGVGFGADGTSTALLTSQVVTCGTVCP
jgi:hypothetical protein